MLLGGIEAGGTKMVMAVADEKGNVKKRESIPTMNPKETIEAMVRWFQNYQEESGESLAALGIGCFGPVDLKKSSKTYGYITTTPKQGWGNTDFIGPFKKALGIPVGFDTDVNAAILGEVRFGAAKDTDSAIYITIGTGVGVGVYVNGNLLHGMLHPEAGHILLRKQAADGYEGKCPFHKTCFEGLASGPAIAGRYGVPATELYDKEEVWELESDYIGQAIANYVMTYSPEKIILWGGVMHKEGLLQKVREKTLNYLNGYISSPKLFEEDYITSPALGDDPGIIGATQLGLDALREQA